MTWRSWECALKSTRWYSTAAITRCIRAYFTKQSSININKTCYIPNCSFSHDHWALAEDLTQNIVQLI